MTNLCADGGLTTFWVVRDHWGFGLWVIDADTETEAWSEWNELMEREEYVPEVGSMERVTMTVAGREATAVEDM